MTETEAMNLTKGTSVIYIPTNTEGFVSETKETDFVVQWLNGFTTRFDYDSPILENLTRKYQTLV